MKETAIEDDEIILKTSRWLERAVIGLNLCPFAAGPYRAGRVRLSVSHERRTTGLLTDLTAALAALQAADPTELETTLLIHPWVLNDFYEFNEFLDVCDEAVRQLGLEGELQVASFHPQYQFAGTAPDDIENYTNRSPYPTLHLLREDSISRVVDAADTKQIPRRNIELLRALGQQGWMNLWREPT